MIQTHVCVWLCAKKTSETNMRGELQETNITEWPSSRSGSPLRWGFWLRDAELPGTSASWGPREHPNIALFGFSVLGKFLFLLW